MCNIITAVGIAISSCLAAAPGAECSQQPGQELREWADNTGKFHVKAAWIAFEGEQIRLRRDDRREISVAIKRLSEADKSYLRQLALADEAAENSWPMLFGGPGEGLRGEYYRDTSLDEIGLVRSDGPLDFEFQRHVPPYEGGKPIKHLDDGWYHDFAIRWTGLLVPRYSERYTLSLEIDDGAALWLGEKMLIHSWKWQASKEYAADVELIAGRPYPVRILYYNGPYGGAIKFSWSSKSQRKELVPRECLFFPAEASQPKPPQDALPVQADLVTVKDIPLSAAVKCDPSLNKPTLFLA